MYQSVEYFCKNKAFFWFMLMAQEISLRLCFCWDEAQVYCELFEVKKYNQVDIVVDFTRTVQT